VVHVEALQRVEIEDRGDRNVAPARLTGASPVAKTAGEEQGRKNPQRASRELTVQLEVPRLVIGKRYRKCSKYYTTARDGPS
jgi:hypothetical protein